MSNNDDEVITTWIRATQNESEKQDGNTETQTNYETQNQLIRSHQGRMKRTTKQQKHDSRQWNLVDIDANAHFKREDERHEKITHTSANNFKH